MPFHGRLLACSRKPSMIIRWQSIWLWWCSTHMGYSFNRNSKLKTRLIPTFTIASISSSTSIPYPSPLHQGHLRGTPFSLSSQGLHFSHPILSQVDSMLCLIWCYVNWTPLSTSPLPISIIYFSMWLIPSVHHFKSLNCGFSCASSCVSHLCLLICSCGPSLLWVNGCVHDHCCHFCVFSWPFCDGRSPRTENDCENSVGHVYHHVHLDKQKGTWSGGMAFTSKMTHLATIVTALTEWIKEYLESLRRLESSWNSTLICFPLRELWS